MASNRNENARKGKLTGATDGGLRAAQLAGGRTRWCAARWDNGLGRSRWWWGCSPPEESDGDGLCLANLVGTRAPLFWDRRTAARSAAGVTRANACTTQVGHARCGVARKAKTGTSSGDGGEAAPDGDGRPAGALQERIGLVKR